jgi:2-oxo-4-hydroxy-4-carboxy-5-ureidoimidazoline decarboxylase
MASLGELNSLGEAAFVEKLGGIYEHSPWVARGAWHQRPFGNVESLHAAMERTVAAATENEKLALIRAHPELAGKLAVAGGLTESSRSEQASAGLDRCTPAEFERLQALNAGYRDKFGFPFIIAVRGLTRGKIIEQMEQRLGNTPEQERAACMREIGRIARLRLDALLTTD